MKEWVREYLSASGGDEVAVEGVFEVEDLSEIF